MNSLFLLLIVTTSFAGLAYYIRIAQKQRNDRIEKFFLAGRNIGVQLFQQTTWASSHGSANGIWYAIWLGYTLGLAGIWLQSFWCIGIFAYSILIPKIVKHTEKFTLHGYLGAFFGKGSRLVASFVSLTGLFVCIGFEISYVSGFYTQVLGIDKNYIVPIIFAFSIFISLFCTIGGFSANAKTDRISNVFATVSVLLLIAVLLWYKFSHSIEIKDATLAPLAENHWSFYLGIAFFGFYQFVDMTNWQTVSANSLSSDPESIKKMQKAVKMAALKILLFPITTGTIAGFLLRNITQNIGQDTILSEITKGYLPPSDIISLVLLCIICFSFLASSLSATNSWLLASSQTISWDLADYKIFNRHNFKAAEMADSEHKGILNRARINLLIIGVVVTALIYWASVRWDQVFALQFVMFGAGTSMIPALVYGLWFCSTESDGKRVKTAAFLSITLGFLFALGLFIVSLVINDPNLVNHIPYCTLGLSTIILLLGILFSKSST